MANIILRALFAAFFLSVVLADVAGNIHDQITILGQNRGYSLNAATTVALDAKTNGVITVVPIDTFGRELTVSHLGRSKVLDPYMNFLMDNFTFDIDKDFVLNVEYNAGDSVVTGDHLFGFNVSLCNSKCVVTDATFPFYNAEEADATKLEVRMLPSFLSLYESSEYTQLAKYVSQNPNTDCPTCRAIIDDTCTCSDTAEFKTAEYNTNARSFAYRTTAGDGIHLLLQNVETTKDEDGAVTATKYTFRLSSQLLAIPGTYAPEALKIKDTTTHVAGQWQVIDQTATTKVFNSYDATQVAKVATAVYTTDEIINNFVNDLDVDGIAVLAKLFAAAAVAAPEGAMTAALNSDATAAKVTTEQITAAFTDVKNSWTTLTDAASFPAGEKTTGNNAISTYEAAETKTLALLRDLTATLTTLVPAGTASDLTTLLYTHLTPVILADGIGSIYAAHVNAAADAAADLVELIAPLFDQTLDTATPTVVYGTRARTARALTLARAMATDVEDSAVTALLQITDLQTTDGIWNGNIARVTFTFAAPATPTTFLSVPYLESADGRFNDVAVAMDPIVFGTQDKSYATVNFPNAYLNTSVYSRNLPRAVVAWGVATPTEGATTIVAKSDDICAKFHYRLITWTGNSAETQITNVSVTDYQSKDGITLTVPAGAHYVYRIMQGCPEMKMTLPAIATEFTINENNSTMPAQTIKLNKVDVARSLGQMNTRLMTFQTTTTNNEKYDLCVDYDEFCKYRTAKDIVTDLSVSSWDVEYPQIYFAYKDTTPTNMDEICPSASNNSADAGKSLFEYKFNRSGATAWTDQAYFINATQNELFRRKYTIPGENALIRPVGECAKLFDNTVEAALELDVTYGTSNVALLTDKKYTARIVTNDPLRFTISDAGAIGFTYKLATDTVPTALPGHNASGKIYLSAGATRRMFTHPFPLGDVSLKLTAAFITDAEVDLGTEGCPAIARAAVAHIDNSATNTTLLPGNWKGSQVFPSRTIAQNLRPMEIRRITLLPMSYNDYNPDRAHFRFTSAVKTVTTGEGESAVTEHTTYAASAPVLRNGMRIGDNRTTTEIFVSSGIPFPASTVSLSIPVVHYASHELGMSTSDSVYIQSQFPPRLDIADGDMYAKATVSAVYFSPAYHIFSSSIFRGLPISIHGNASTGTDTKLKTVTTFYELGTAAAYEPLDSSLGDYLLDINANSDKFKEKFNKGTDTVTEYADPIMTGFVSLGTTFAWTFLGEDNNTVSAILPIRTSVKTANDQAVDASLAIPNDTDGNPVTDIHVGRETEAEITVQLDMPHYNTHDVTWKIGAVFINKDANVTPSIADFSTLPYGKIEQVEKEVVLKIKESTEVRTDVIPVYTTEGKSKAKAQYLTKMVVAENCNGYTDCIVSTKGTDIDFAFISPKGEQNCTVAQCAYIRKDCAANCEGKPNVNTCKQNCVDTHANCETVAKCDLDCTDDTCLPSTATFTVVIPAKYYTRNTDKLYFTARSVSEDPFFDNLYVESTKYNIVRPEQIVVETLTTPTVFTGALAEITDGRPQTLPSNIYPGTIVKTGNDSLTETEYGITDYTELVRTLENQDIANKAYENTAALLTCAHYMIHHPAHDTTTYPTDVAAACTQSAWNATVAMANAKIMHRATVGKTDFYPLFDDGRNSLSTTVFVESPVDESKVTIAHTKTLVVKSLDDVSFAVPKTDAEDALTYLTGATPTTAAAGTIDCTASVVKEVANDGSFTIYQPITPDNANATLKRHAAQAAVVFITCTAPGTDWKQAAIHIAEFTVTNTEGADSTTATFHAVIVPTADVFSVDVKDSTGSDQPVSVLPSPTPTPPPTDPENPEAPAFAAAGASFEDVIHGVQMGSKIEFHFRRYSLPHYHIRCARYASNSYSSPARRHNLILSISMPASEMCASEDATDCPIKIGGSPIGVKNQGNCKEDICTFEHTVAVDGAFVDTTVNVDFNRNSNNIVTAEKYTFRYRFEIVLVDGLNTAYDLDPAETACPLINDSAYNKAVFQNYLADYDATNGAIDHLTFNLANTVYIKPSNTSMWITIGCVVAAIVIVVAGGVGWYFRSRAHAKRQRRGIAEMDALEFDASVMVLVEQIKKLAIPRDEVVIGRQIGVGGFGAVSVASWVGTQVCVKQLHAHLVGNTSNVESFIAEAITMSNLRHPNVVAFLGAIAHPPAIWLVTELCARGSLTHYIRKEPRPSLSNRLKLAHGSALGLRYLHGRDMVHRDIKADNILIDASYTAKIADLGLARLVDRSATMSTVGTPAWFAPELFLNQQHAHYSEKIDVYSFGVMLWEILTGEAPFANVPPMKVPHRVAIHRERPPIPEGSDAEFVELIQDCWQHEPEKRPSMDEVAERIMAIVVRLTGSDDMTITDDGLFEAAITMDVEDTEQAKGKGKGRRKVKAKGKAKAKPTTATAVPAGDAAEMV